MIYKYFTCGSESEKEGLTLAVNAYDDDGNFVAGVENVKKHLYKAKEITRDEYDNYVKRFNDPNELRGMYGLANEKGKELADAFFGDLKKQKIEQAEPKIIYIVKKIKKQLALGIIEEDDIDTEIELNNMLEFKDEIKRRLTEE